MARAPVIDDDYGIRHMVKLALSCIPVTVQERRGCHLKPILPMRSSGTSGFPA